MKKMICKDCGGEIYKKVQFYRYCPIDMDGEDDEDRLDVTYETEGHESEIYECNACDNDTNGFHTQLEDIAEWREG